MEIGELEIQKYHNQKIRRRVKIIGFIVTLIILVVSLLSLTFYGFYKEKISQEVSAYGEIALFFGVAFLEFVPQLLSSYFPLIISIISGINFFNAVIIAVISSLLSSIFAFEVGRRFGWKFACSFVHYKKLIKIVNFWNKYGKTYVFLSAITPLLYFPLFYGSIGITRKNMWFFGIIPRIISFILVGYLIYLGRIFI